jgi:hypothetical protein
MEVCAAAAGDCKGEPGYPASSGQSRPLRICLPLRYHILMADTLTLHIDPATVAALRRAADASRVSLEALAERLIEEGVIDLVTPYTSRLSEEQLADLEERLKDPGPVGSAEEVETFFARFKA